MLAQFQDEVAGRQRKSPRPRWASDMTSSAFGTGIKLQQLLPGKIAESLIPYCGGFLGNRGKTLAGQWIFAEQIGESGQHMDRFRIRNVGHKGERGRRMQPPAIGMQA